MSTEVIMSEIIDVLRLRADGFKIREIASSIGVTERTVLRRLAMARRLAPLNLLSIEELRFNERPR